MAKTLAYSSVGLIGIMVLALVVSPGIAKSPFNCRTLLGLLAPCKTFFLNQTLAPSSDCCVGAQGLASVILSSHDNMVSSCKCLKSAGKKKPVPIPIAMQLLSSCNIHINMTIDPNYNCTSL